jgi:hypothetical protein
LEFESNFFSKKFSRDMKLTALFNQILPTINEVAMPEMKEVNEIGKVDRVVDAKDYSDENKQILG